MIMILFHRTPLPHQTLKCIKGNRNVFKTLYPLFIFYGIGSGDFFESCIFCCQFMVVFFDLMDCVWCNKLSNITIISQIIAFQKLNHSSADIFGSIFQIWKVDIIDIIVIMMFTHLIKKGSGSSGIWDIPGKIGHGDTRSISDNFTS